MKSSPKEAGDVERVLRDFVETVTNTGGVIRDAAGLHHPVADPDWIDIGECYMEACKVLEVNARAEVSESGEVE